jgi:hypothetical protein
MKTKISFLVLCFACILGGCRTATPLPLLTAGMDNEFTLAPGQSAAVTGADLTITFNSVVSDDRCPSEVECVASGSVAVSLSVQQGGDPATDVTLQTFTDQEGYAPEREFEGIQNRAETDNTVMRLVRVLPYPQNLSEEIKDDDYQVTLLVTGK